jgi:prepilin-type N-terminal cleavage/methylation domain-containing protein
VVKAKPRPPRGEEDGLSLTELLVVIAIIAILAAVVSLSLGGLTSRATASRNEANRASVQAAVDAYSAATSGEAVGPWFPTANKQAGTIVARAADGAGQTFVPTYIRSMPAGTWAVNGSGIVTGP